MSHVLHMDSTYPFGKRSKGRGLIAAFEITDAAPKTLPTAPPPPRRLRDPATTLPHHASSPLGPPPHGQAPRLARVPRPTAQITHAAKLEFSSEDRSENREAGHDSV